MTPPVTSLAVASAPQNPGTGASLSPAIRALPGIFLAGLVAMGADAMHVYPALSIVSPMLLAIILGMAIHNIAGTPERAGPGLAFASKKFLRVGVMLLGLQITAGQILELGGASMAAIIVIVAASMAFTMLLGRALGVPPKLARLIAAGTSICGASAVAATDAVTGAEDEDVAYAIACVTVFGTLSMFLYPAIGGLLHLSDHAYGVWTGSSIHEVAQVIAAGYQRGTAAGDVATVAKLGRVALLIPIVLVMGVFSATASQSSAQNGACPPVPMFLLGFIALVAVNSVFDVPEAIKHVTAQTAGLLLTTALAAMGLETNFMRLKAMGVRPFLLGMSATIFITLLALACAALLW